MQQDLTLSGVLEITIRDRYGRIRDHEITRNLIVSAGKALVAGRLGGLNSSVFKWVALGLDATDPAAGDTALGNEITTGGGARALATTVARVTTTVANDTLHLVKVFTFSADFVIVEAGIFDQLTVGGNMLARSTDFDPKTVTSGDTSTVDWKVVVK